MIRKQEQVPLTNFIQEDFETFVKSFLSHISLLVEESMSKAVQITTKEEIGHINHPKKLDGIELLITRKETLNFLKISAPTLHRYQKEGLIPYYKVGRKVFFKLSELIISTKVISKNTGEKRLEVENDR